MDLENLFEKINLDYEYNSNDNLAIVEEILSTENVDEIYKMCIYIKKKFVIDEDNLVYKDLHKSEKNKIKKIRELLFTILEIYPYHRQLIIDYFKQFYELMKSLCFT